MKELSTVLTDYVLAGVALGLAWRLSRPSSRSAPGLLWAASFVALAFAGLIGGTWHGLPADVLPVLRRALWVTTYVAIGAANLLMLSGAARATLSRRHTWAAIAILTGGLGTCTALVVSTGSFRWVAAEFAFTMGMLLAFGFDLVRRREPAARLVLAGVFVSLAGGVVLALRLAPHSSFNHNDVFHVVQTVGLWLFQRAGLQWRSC